MLTMFGFRRYAVTLHHRSGRTVDMGFHARSLEHATAKAWQWGKFDHWEGANINDGAKTAWVVAPDHVAGRVA